MGEREKERNIARKRVREPMNERESNAKERMCKSEKVSENKKEGEPVRERE